jgi:molybdenum cofactor guanylyltransferase
MAQSENAAVVGVVIAGGRSTRFGGEKAVALLEGQTLLMRAVQRLQRSCCTVAVNARTGTEAAASAEAATLPVLTDLAGDPDGPLAGVHVGLRWAKAQGARAIAVSPCDAPLLPGDLYDRLIAAAGEGAAMAVTPSGRQPLCAVWPVSALETVAAALAGGAHPPTWRLLESVGAVAVSFDESDAFTNVNTRADLAAVEHRLTSDRDR